MLEIKPNSRLNEYVIIEEISSYAKNSIFKAYIPSQEEPFDESHHKVYIIKAIPYETDDEIESYKNEAEIQHLFSDVSEIIKYSKTFILKNEVTADKRYLFAVMNFYSFIDLFDYYSNHELAKVDQIRTISYQALTILNTIHKKNVVHHDIKPANFLIESLSPFKIKITDFEFAVKLSDDNQTNQPFGTIFYMAPEMLSCYPHDKSVDIWALGISLYEIAAKKLPFNLKFEQPQRFLIKMRIEKNQLTFDNFSDQNFKDLLSKMLQKEPENRITAEEALNHPFFEGFKLDF